MLTGKSEVPADNKAIPTAIERGGAIIISLGR